VLALAPLLLSAEPRRDDATPALRVIRGGKPSTFEDAA
jgi:hypothetical protein